MESDSVVSILAGTIQWAGRNDGLIGVVLGAAISILGNIIAHRIQTKPDRKLAEARKKLLSRMLEDKRFQKRWRYLSTLSTVIGASSEETTRLLVEIGARGSETGDGRWGLIKHHPLSEIKEPVSETL